jgi:SAM-dependent methyltransferase
LNHLGHSAEGIDLDTKEVEIALQLFPNIKIGILNAEDLDQWRPSNFYDAIVFKDCLHHIIGEHNSEAVMVGLCHVLRPGGRLIVLDPNPNWILRLARKLIHHHDPEAQFELAKQWVEHGPFLVRSMEYYEVVGVALSGGYVGIEWVPAWPLLLDTIAWVNHMLSQLVNAIGLGPQLCWRYVFCAEKLSD